MATEVKLPQGWLRKDVQRASERLDRGSTHLKVHESASSSFKEASKSVSGISALSDKPAKQS